MCSKFPKELERVFLPLETIEAHKNSKPKKRFYNRVVDESVVTQGNARGSNAMINEEDFIDKFSSNKKPVLINNITVEQDEFASIPNNKSH